MIFYHDSMQYHIYKKKPYITKWCCSQNAIFNKKKSYDLSYINDHIHQTSLGELGARVLLASLIMRIRFGSVSEARLMFQVLHICNLFGTVFYSDMNKTE